MSKKTTSESAKNRKRDGKGPLERNSQKHPERSGWGGSPGGPKGPAPDKHGGSGAGRQEGGSGAGRER